ncbi:MAG: SDR family NAD(P)-dependent oxidoreductase [Acidimicrobiales bacterium]|nr:SDR family NAD(P)-dependent oxidoreductase [Acidimicrobiales bacterium]
MQAGMQVEDRVVVVTGAARGIGAALGRRFAADGAKAVVVADVDAAGAQQVADAIGGVAYSVDVSTEQGVAGLITHTEQEVGPIALFCSNAGIMVPGGAEVPDDSWQRILAVNVMAHVWSARHLVPRFLERKPDDNGIRGWFLTTASAAGLLSQIGSAPYSVTKHAALAFAEWLAITYGDRGIGVSALCPQAVNTAMTAGVAGGGVAGVDGMLEPDDVAACAAEGIATGRFLILPHKQVQEYFRRKADDYDRWLTGMRRLQARFATPV